MQNINNSKDNYTKGIEVYKRDEKNPDKTYNIEFVTEYDISLIPISELKKIIVPNPNDENLFLMYTLNEFQLIEIQKRSNVFFEIDNEKFIYMFSQYS